MKIWRTLIIDLLQNLFLCLNNLAIYKKQTKSGRAGTLAPTEIYCIFKFFSLQIFIRVIYGNIVRASVPARPLLNRLLLLMVLFLTACSSQKIQNINDRMTQMSNLNEWQAFGKVGIQTAADSGTVSIDWLQNNQTQDYHITLTAPFGQGEIDLQGNEIIATVKMPDGRILENQNLEQVLQSEIGFFVPLINLKWWILGVPNPHTPYTFELNQNGLIDTLQQDEWALSYKSYQTISNNILLPRRFTAHSKELDLNMVVNNWNVRL
jgi:outer membrane lipoprotein LolB